VGSVVICEDPKSGGFGLKLHLEIRTRWWSRVWIHLGGAVVNIQEPSTWGCGFFLEQPLAVFALLTALGSDFYQTLCEILLQSYNVRLSICTGHGKTGPLKSFYLLYVTSLEGCIHCSCSSDTVLIKRIEGRMPPGGGVTVLIRYLPNG